jgi:putative oxidoreductase
MIPLGMKRSHQILYWVARLVAAIIMVQTLYFKFSGASESVYIFSTIGMEPWGRIGVGVMELVASILLLVGSTAWVGAALALGLMLGAISMHVTRLGIEVQGDGGYLFFLAVAVSMCSIVVLTLNRNNIATLLSRLR